jgi:hypothetical protein
MSTQPVVSAPSLAGCGTRTSGAAPRRERTHMVFGPGPSTPADTHTAEAEARAARYAALHGAGDGGAPPPRDKRSRLRHLVSRIRSVFRRG